MMLITNCDIMKFGERILTLENQKEVIEMEIIKPGDYFIQINYYWYGVTYTGSYDHMRYLIKREPSANLFYNSDERNNPDARMIAMVWPEPFTIEKTKPDLIMTEEFPFTDEGIEQLRQWINSQYDQHNFKLMEDTAYKKF